MMARGLVLLLGWCWLVVGQQNWTRCDVVTNCFAPPCPTYGLVADCSLTSLPLDWTASGSPSFDVFVKRIYDPLTGPTQKHLWLLMGGPGFSGSLLDNYAVSLLQLLTGYTVYIPDQRGTGRSFPLVYPSNCNGTMGHCMNKTYYQVLPYFTVTQSAMDIIALMSSISKDSVRYLYGWSYGTFLLNRILQLQGDIADKYIFEGLCPPGLCKWDVFEANSNAVGMSFLEMCGSSSATCRKYLGPRPAVTAQLIIEQINYGTLPCLAKLTHPLTAMRLKSLLGNFLPSWYGRSVIAPILKRLVQCSDNDAAEVDKLLSFGVGLEGKGSAIPTDVFISQVGSHIIISELLTYQPSSTLDLTKLGTKLSYTDDNLIFSLNQGLGTFISDWPIYKTDQYYNKFGSTSKPYLVLHGELDPQTSYGFFRSAGSYGPNGLAVSVPYGPHQTTASESSTGVGRECSLSVLVSFLGGDPKIDCLSSIPGPDFEGTSPEVLGISNVLWGRTNIWGDVE